MIKPAFDFEGFNAAIDKIVHTLEHFAEDFVRAWEQTFHPDWRPDNPVPWVVPFSGEHPVDWIRRVGPQVAGRTIYADEAWRYYACTRWEVPQKFYDLKAEWNIHD